MRSPCAIPLPNEQTHLYTSTQNRAITELKKVLTPEDAPLAVRLVLADAATYDVKTGKGGVNASIILSYVFNLHCLL